MSSTKDGSSPIFSFSFNAEILSFFGGNVNPGDENALVVASSIPPKPSTVSLPLFGTLLSQRSVKTRIISVIQYSAATTGILLTVGLGSYCAFICLQQIRQLEFRELINSGSFWNWGNVWHTIRTKLRFYFPQRKGKTKRYEKSNSNLERSTEKLGPLYNVDQLNGGSIKMSTNDLKIVASQMHQGHIVTSDEDVEDEIQPEYFGPALEVNQGLKLGEIEILAGLFRQSSNERGSE